MKVALLLGLPVDYRLPSCVFSGSVLFPGCIVALHGCTGSGHALIVEVERAVASGRGDCPVYQRQMRLQYQAVPFYHIHGRYVVTGFKLGSVSEQLRSCLFGRHRPIVADDASVSSDPRGLEHAGL
jgi:hypothetical protein